MNVYLLESYAYVRKLYTKHPAPNSVSVAYLSQQSHWATLSFAETKVLKFSLRPKSETCPLSNIFLDCVGIRTNIMTLRSFCNETKKSSTGVLMWLPHKIITQVIHMYFRFRHKMRPIVTAAARSVYICVSIGHKHESYKRLNRSRCRLGYGFGWSQGTMY